MEMERGRKERARLVSGKRAAVERASLLACPAGSG
jgi:hypothetical protein